MTTSLNKFTKGIVLKGESSDVSENQEGTLFQNSSSSRIKSYIEGAIREVVTNSQSQVLTNKTINVDNNSVSNIQTSNLKSGVLNTSTSLATASDIQLPSALAAKSYTDKSISSIIGGSFGSGELLSVNDYVYISNGTGNDSTRTAGYAYKVDVTNPDRRNGIGFVTSLGTSSVSFSESFESGSFTTNSWNLVNGTQVNQWAIGTATSNSGTYSAYVSNNGGTSNAYTTTSSSSSYFYKDIAVPSSSSPVALTFSYKVMGEKIGSTSYDYLSVIVDPNLTVTPVAGTSILSTPSGGIRNLYTNNPSWATISISLDAYKGTTVRIIFGWTNDLSAGTQPPAAVDDIKIEVIADAFVQTSGIISYSGVLTTGKQYYASTAGAITTTQPSSDAIVVGTSLSTSLLAIRPVASTASAEIPFPDLDRIAQFSGLDLSKWTTGNNSTFLGTGTMLGTFASDTTTPVNGISSYKYTQAAGSLNDYAATPIQTVARKFRGSQATLYFPYTYDGATNDIEVIVYDATNSAIIPNSAFIQFSSTNAIFKTNITIPTTCQSIRIGFMTRVANSGKIFAFDDIQLTSDTTVYATLAESQSYVASLNASNAPTTILKATGSGLFSTSSTGSRIRFTALKNIQISGAGYRSNSSTAPTSSLATWYLNGTVITEDRNFIATGGSNQQSSESSINTQLNSGEYVEFEGAIYSGGTFLSASVSVIATSTSDQILTAPEVFSTDTASLTYSSTYTLSTLNTAPVGTYITFTYAANTNTRTQTSTRPTQTDADMNTNGIQIFTRAYNAASTAASPAAIAIQIGKGLKGRSLDLYKSAGKVTAGSLDAFNETSTVRSGAVFKEYNQQTGILIVDVGYCINTTITSSLFYFSDVTTATNGYLVINASKNPALTGLDINAVGSRYTSTAGGSIAITDTVQTFATKDYDTNSAFSGTTFTAPVAGYYQIDGQIATAAVTLTTSQSLAVRLYLNGAIKTTGITNGVGVNLNYFCRISDIYFLRAGDTVQLQAASSVATTQWTGIGNFLSIVKVSV